MENKTTETKMGRKKTLPEGARITSFSLTEEERLAVKKFVVEMRREHKAQELANKAVVKVEDFGFNMIIKLVEEVAYTLICLAGNRRSFARIEKAVKDAAIIGFKNAFDRWENVHPRKYDAEGKEIRE